MNTIVAFASFFITLVESFTTNSPTRIDSFHSSNDYYHGNVLLYILFEFIYAFIISVSISIITLFICAAFMNLHSFWQRKKQMCEQDYLRRHTIITNMIIICDLHEKVNIPSLYANTENEPRLTKRKINGDYRMIMTMNVNPEKQFYQKIVIYKTGIIKFSDCRDYNSFIEAKKQFHNLLETHIHPFVEFWEQSQSINSRFRLPGRINRLSFYSLLDAANIPCVIAAHCIIVRYEQMKIIIYENGDMVINNATSYQQIINYHKQVRKVYKQHRLYE